MTNQTFEIKILDLHWIKYVDDPTDLCAHGHLYLKIGNQILSNKDNGDWTLSVTALNLMRTISSDYKANDFACQLIPCCGHFMVVDERTNELNILGCSSGIDWTIVNLGKNVTHLTGDGQEVVIDNQAYRKIVFNFADQVDQFYRNSKPKSIPDDESDRNAYLAFWKEWSVLRSS